MTNHKDALIGKIKERCDLSDKDPWVYLDDVEEIINQHFDAVPDGDMVERVAKAIFKEAKPYGMHDYTAWLPHAKAAIEAMGAAEKVDLADCRFQVEAQCGNTPEFNWRTSHLDVVIRAVLTAAGVKWEE